MNMKKVLFTIIIGVLLSILFLPNSYATTASDILSDGEDFLRVGDDESTVINKPKLSETSSIIYKVLLTIAICVSVVVGAVLGFQFVLGSVEGKVKVQEALVPYIVGCVVVFGAFTIWGFAVNTGSDITDGYETEGFDTPAVSGGRYFCEHCGGDLGTIPAGVIVGGRQWLCPNCNQYTTPQN